MILTVVFALPRFPPIHTDRVLPVFLASFSSDPALTFGKFCRTPTSTIGISNAQSSMMILRAIANRKKLQSKRINTRARLFAIVCADVLSTICIVSCINNLSTTGNLRLEWIWILRSSSSKTPEWTAGSIIRGAPGWWVCFTSPGSMPAFAWLLSYPPPLPEV